jgi:hypothetical protein
MASSHERAVARAALTGEPAGQPLNPEGGASRVSMFVVCAEGNLSRRDSTRAGGLRP